MGSTSFGQCFRGFGRARLTGDDLSVDRCRVRGAGFDQLAAASMAGLGSVAGVLECFGVLRVSADM